MSETSLIEGLVGQAPCRRGEFTLDREQAREKMRRFQLADPRGYVLELVQCAVLRGATRIDFRLDTDDCHVWFDGPPFDRMDLQRAEAAALESVSDPALRQLGLAISAAMGMNPAFVRVESAGVQLELRPGESDRCQSVRDKPGTRLHVRDRLSSGQVLAFLRHLVGSHEEGTLLLRSCLYCPIPVRLNGRNLTRPLEEFVRDGVVRVQGGVGGFERGAPGALAIMKDGVLIETVEKSLGPMPFRALLTAPDLVKNVSQTRIVRDAAFERLLQTFRAARSESLACLCRESRSEWSLLLRQEVLHHEKLTEVPAYLAQLPLWPTATGRCSPVSLADILSTPGDVPYSSERHLGLEMDGMRMILLAGEPQLFERLKERLNHRMRNVTRRLQNKVKAEVNKRAWKARKREPVLAGRGWRIKRALPGGEVGLGNWERNPCVRLILNECELVCLWLTVPLWGLEAVVTGDFTPSENFDSVRRDDALAEALARIARTLPELYTGLALAARRMDANTARALRGYVQLASEPGWGRKLFLACGFSEARAALAPELPPPGEALLQARIYSDGRTYHSLSELRKRPSLEYLAPGQKSRNKSLLRLLPEEAAFLGARPAQPDPTGVTRPSADLPFLQALQRQLTAICARDPLRAPSFQLRLERHNRLCQSGELGRRHPLVAIALKTFQQEPLVLSFLASLMLDDRSQAFVAEHVLAGNPLPAEEASPVEGLLEPISLSGAVLGRALDPARPGEPVRVHLMVCEPGGLLKTVATVIASPDFQAQIPRLYQDGVLRQVLARAEVGGGLADLPGSPRPYLSACPDPRSPIGHFDRVDADGMASGWAIDPNTPDQPVGIHFYLDGPAGHGEFVGGTSTGLPRPDVEKATGYAGQHGFSFKLAPELLDGSEHVLYAYALDTAGGHNPLLCGSPFWFSY